ncbi:two-partner secretion domain-containing protein [Dyella japonica]|uniref:Filamentous hemagglutinin n=1 Tax=Dyella japonica TaxID=231455 RepID=A0ABV2JYK9_9GAMM
MNKHLYRLVFNRALRILQVASELTPRSRGDATSASGGVTTARVRPVSFSLWVALGFVAYASVATAGQIITDANAPGNQRPTVLGSPGQAALINIQTPNAQGVSRNTYTQFDVDSSGVVFNNARTPAQSQLAGAVGANPWLATGTAKVILNEVTGPNVSQLHGTMEIAGDKADLIIANPAGISCAGCGVINVSRFQLTTGVPVLSGGSLDSYRVTGGTIQINGNGLDATRADYTDIIARAVQVNAGIWAPQLQVTTGSNQVSADHTQITPIAGNGAAPTFALDVSALGGMYANKIQLLGTEYGVGVRNAGNLGAQAGDLVVTADGRLENTGSLQSQADTTITASGGVSNSGTISATNTLSITTPQDVDNSGGSLNAGRLAVDAGSLRNAGGTIAQTGLQGMALQAGALSNQGGSIGMPVADAGSSTDGSSGSGDTPPTSDPGTNSGGSATSSNGGTSGTTPAPLAAGVLQIAGLLDNDGGQIHAASGFDLTTAHGLNNDGGQLGLRQLTLTGGDVSNRAGTLTINGPVTLQGGNVYNDAGTLNVADALTINVQNLSNRGGTITHRGTDTTTLSVANTLDNTGGTLASQASALTLSSGTLINEGGTIVHAGTDGLTLNAGTWQGANGTVATAGAATVQAGSIDHRGATLSATQVHLTAANVNNEGGTLVASGDQANTLTVSGALDNSNGGTIASNADLAIDAGTLGNANGGAIQHVGTGTLSIAAATLNGRGGAIQSNGQLRLTGTMTDLSGGTTSAQQVTITTGTLRTAGGSLQALGGTPLAVQVAGAWDNTAGQVATNGAWQISAGSITNSNGSLIAAGTDATTLAVTHAIDNTAGTIAAQGATTIHADTLINQGGTVQAANAPLSVTAVSLLDNSQHGVVASDGDLSLTAATLDNTQGVMAHAGTGTLSIAATTLNGSGGTIESNGLLQVTGGTTDLSNGTTAAQQVVITTGTLSTAHGSLQAAGTTPLAVQVAGAWDNTAGQVATNGALQIDAQSLTNTGGSLQAAGDDATTITVANALNNTQGVLSTVGPTTVHTGSLDNTSGRLQAASTSPFLVQVDGALTNDSGTLMSNGDVQLTAGALSNHGGTLATQQAIDATVTGTLDNRNAGAIIAGGDLTVQTSALLNGNTSGTQGLHGQQVTLNVATLDNTAGEIQASNGLAVTGGALTNVGGVLDGQGTVAITGTALTNTGGQIIQRGDTGALAIAMTQALSNTAGGLIGAEGTASLHAGAIDNSGGTTYAQHDLALSSDGSLSNTNGGLLQTNGDLAVSAGATLDNSAGHVDASGAATVSAAALTNTGGQLLAGTTSGGLDTATPDAALTLTTTGAIANQGGTVGNRGGDVVLQAASVDNRNGGTVVAQRDLTLDQVASFNNAGGTTYATRDLSFQNPTTTLDNTGGQFGAGNTATLNLASLTNDTTGLLQGSSLWLTAPTVSNNGGTITANDLHVTLASLTGAGTLNGTQSLDLHATGDFTNGAGQSLQSNGTLDLTVNGTLTNQGTLQTPGTLNVTAANLINQGTINASASDGSGVANVNVSGTLNNQASADLEGDTLAINAGTITNTGNLSGNVVAISADTLTNGQDVGQAMAPVDYGQGFIGAAQSLRLAIGRALTNIDADIYSGGDLSIGGRTPGTNVSSLLNSSGRIEAEGNLTLAADTLTNTRRILPTVSGVMPVSIDLGSTVISGSGPNGPFNEEYCLGAPNNQCFVQDPSVWIANTVISQQTLSPASAAGVITAGGDIAITTGHLLNQVSTIAAGNNLTINGGGAATDANGNLVSGDPATIQNEAISVQQTVQTQQVTRTIEDVYQDCYQAGGSRTPCHPDNLETTSNTTTTTTTGVAMGSYITAGGTVSISGGNISNTAVNAGGGGNGIITGNLAGAGSTGLGSAQGAQAGSAGGVSGAQGSAVAPANGTRGATGQVLGPLDHPLPGLVPPSNGRYTDHPDPSAPFLVTTAPRFAQGPVTSSNYLLQALGDDPANMHKRLGDGYYEQNLVMDQVLQLTGRRVLNGATDAADQYQALMQDAANQAAALGLTLGAPLTASEIASLTSDIVWLVDEVVDGQDVLVPVVYLSKAGADQLETNGALIAGQNVNINASGTVTNDGTLTGTQGTTILADTLINTGAISGAQQLAIATQGDLINRGTLSGGNVSLLAGGNLTNTAPSVPWASAATISATGNLAMVAGGNIVSTGSLPQWTGAKVVSGPTAISAGGNLSMIAGGDLTLIGSGVSAGGDALLAAGGNLNLLAQGTQSSNSRGGNGTGPLSFQEQTASQGAVISSVTAGGNLSLVAGGNLDSQAAKLAAGNNLAVQAGGSVILDDVSTEQYSHVAEAQGDKTSLNRTSDQVTVTGSQLSAGGSLSVVAGGDIDAAAAKLTAGGDAALVAGGQINLLADANTLQSSDATKDGHTKTSDQVDISTVQGTQVSAGGGIALISGGDQTYQAATLNSTTGTTIISGGTVNFDTAANVDNESHTMNSKSWYRVAMSNQGIESTTNAQSTISGPLSVNAANGVTVQFGQLAGESQDAALARLAANPGQSWLSSLGPNVNWMSVADTHTTWDQSQSGMGAGLAAVVTIVAVAVTAGAASAAVGAMAAAEAGSGTAMAAAGAGTAAGWGNAIVTGAALGAEGGGLSAGLQGQNIGQGMLHGAVQGGVSAGLFYGAGSLAQYEGWSPGSAPTMLAHGVAGGTTNVLMGGSFKNGLISSAVADSLGNDPNGNIGLQTLEHAGTGAAASWLTGGNATQGAINGAAGYLFNDAMHYSRAADGTVTATSPLSDTAQAQDQSVGAYIGGKIYVAGMSILNTLNGAIPFLGADESNAYNANGVANWGSQNSVLTPAWSPSSQGDQAIYAAGAMLGGSILLAATDRLPETGYLTTLTDTPIPNSPLAGVTYEGPLYRAVPAGGDPLDISYSVNANGRYTAPGQAGLYFASNAGTVEAEFVNNNSSLIGRDLNVFSNSSVNNLLDLTDPAVRNELGVSLEDIARTGGTAAWRYEVTQPLGAYAQFKNYNGIIAPSAQADGGVNLILFDAKGVK